MKKAMSFFLALLMLASMLSLFSSCGSNSKKEYYIPDLFDTDTYIYDYSGLESKEFLEVCGEVRTELEKYHKLYDIRNKYDGIVNLCLLNERAGKGPVEVPKEIIDLLSFSQAVHKNTGGHTNIAMGSVLRLWQDCAKNEGRLPTEYELAAAAEHTDINDIVVNVEKSTVEILDSQLQIDVGAVAKGFAVEAVSRMLENGGYSGMVIDAGGNLRAIGTKPDGSGWLAAVSNPGTSAAAEYPYKLQIKDEALVTSGGYRRYYVVNGEKYHHIINKDTLFPANTYLSVSVKAPSSAYADAYSTAIFNMSYDEVCVFAEKHTELFVILIMNDGEVRTVGKSEQ